MLGHRQLCRVGIPRRRQLGTGNTTRIGSVRPLSSQKNHQGERPTREIRSSWVPAGSAVGKATEVLWVERMGVQWFSRAAARRAAGRTVLAALVASREVGVAPFSSS